MKYECRDFGFPFGNVIMKNDIVLSASEIVDLLNELDPDESFDFMEYWNAGRLYKIRKFIEDNTDLDFNDVWCHDDMGFITIRTDNWDTAKKVGKLIRDCGVECRTMDLPCTDTVLVWIDGEL